MPTSIFSGTSTAPADAAASSSGTEARRLGPSTFCAERNIPVGKGGVNGASSVGEIGAQQHTCTPFAAPHLCLPFRRRLGQCLQAARRRLQLAALPACAARHEVRRHGGGHAPPRRTWGAVALQRSTAKGYRVGTQALTAKQPRGWHTAAASWQRLTSRRRSTSVVLERSSCSSAPHTARRAHRARTCSSPAQRVLARPAARCPLPCPCILPPAPPAPALHYPPPHTPPHSTHTWARSMRASASWRSSTGGALGMMQRQTGRQEQAGTRWGQLLDIAFAQR